MGLKNWLAIIIMHPPPTKENATAFLARNPLRNQAAIGMTIEMVN